MASVVCRAKSRLACRVAKQGVESNNCIKHPCCRRRTKSKQNMYTSEWNLKLVLVLGCETGPATACKQLRLHSNISHSPDKIFPPSELTSKVKELPSTHANDCANACAMGTQTFTSTSCHHKRQRGLNVTAPFHRQHIPLFSAS